MNTLICALLIAMTAGRSFGDEGSSSEPPRLTHADAAVIFAKHLGLFDRYVARDATPDECVSFLNKTGIYFGLLEIVQGADFSKKDCARVIGQIELVLSGEAEYSYGKVTLPKDVESWEEYCVLNGLEYQRAYEQLRSLSRSSPG